MSNKSLHTISYKKHIILFFFLIGSCVYGQNGIDSLQNLLVTSRDSVKVEVLNQLSKSLNHTDPKKSLQYAFEAKQLALELDNLVLLGKSINNIGVSYYYLNELSLSNESYFESLSIFDSIDYKPGVAMELNNIAWNYKVQELYDDAINYFNQSLEITEDFGDLDLQQKILNNLGTVYRNISRYDKALEVYWQSLNLNQQSGNKMWEAYNLNNIGAVYMDRRQFDEAFEYFDQAKMINLKYNYTQEYARNILMIGSVYIASKDFLKADVYLDSAYTIIDKNGYKREKLEYYDYKVNLYTNSQNFKEALKFEQLYNELNIELNRVAWNESVTEIQTKFDVEQKAKDLEASERIVNQQRLVIFGGVALLLLLLLILLLVLKLYKSKNVWAKNIEKLNEEIKQKNEELITMNEDIQGINSNLEQIVDERTKKIKLQNDKLVKYAFINAHEIRGPLARVLGLLYLIGLEKKYFQEDDSFRLLNEATHELDDMIKQASELLEDEDIFIENESQKS